MIKKLSYALAFSLMLLCSAFAFNAFAEEGNLPPDPALPIAITNDNAVLGLSASSYNYDGKAKAPNTSVTYTDEEGNRTVLTKGTDYTVSYSNNINAGKAVATIECIGNYSGTLSKSYTIKPVSVSGSAVSVSLSYTSCTFDGKSKTPVPTVVWNNNGKKVTLVKGTDYTVKYSNNRNIGQATVKITGANNFSGTVNKNFSILPQKVTGVKITGSTANSVTLKWNKQSYISGYRIYKYDTKTRTYKFVKAVSANTTSTTVTGLSASTAYHFKVRSYTKINNQTIYYGALSADVATATAPSRVTVTSVTKSGTTINVEWKTTKSSGYQIFYSTDKSFKKNVKCITLKGAGKSSYKIKNVSKSSVYYVKVRAYINYNDGAHKGICSSPISTYYSNLYARYSSSYVNNANRTNNLIIASNAINGTIVKPGETFSFNNVVGPRTAARGYKSAPVFSGSGVEDGIGGGICQVASTMFNCALLSNVGIVERHQHSQRVSYVPLGRDAAIYGTVEDLKWKNTTNYPIRIVMTVKDGTITCSFYTSVKAKPPKVSLNVTQSGKNFTLRRSVNGKVNYTCKSNY